MPSISTSCAPLIARAVAFPPEGVTITSRVPWIDERGGGDRRDLGRAVARGDDGRELAAGARGVVAARVGALGDRAQLVLVEGEVGRADQLEGRDDGVDRRGLGR